MAKIVLVGANSQVATEVAYFLSLNSNTELVCIVRSEYGSVLLRRLGIDVRVCDFADSKELHSCLFDADLVVDCTYPADQLPLISTRIRALIDRIVVGMKPHSRFVYWSSIMAFGCSQESNPITNKWIARSSYAAIKRNAERFALKACRRSDVGCYNLRLSQVHGYTQGVTTAWKQELSWNSLQVIGSPNDLTNTIFTSCVANALLRIAEGQIEPGTYTLVSQPQWSLKALYDFYGERYSLPLSLQFKTNRRVGWGQAAKRSLSSLAMKYRNIVEAHVLIRSKYLFQWAKGNYRVQRARSLTPPAEGDLRGHLLGMVPGKAINDIGSDWDIVMQNDRRLESTLRDVCRWDSCPE